MTTPIDNTHFLCGATARHHHPKVGFIGYQMKALGARNHKYTSLLHATSRFTRWARPFDLKCCFYEWH